MAKQYQVMRVYEETLDSLKKLQKQMKDAGIDASLPQLMDKLVGMPDIKVKIKEIKLNGREIFG